MRALRPLVGLAVLAGCTAGGGTGGTVDDDLTIAAARERVVVAARRAVDALPAGTTLTRQREGDSFTPDDPVGPTGCLPTEHPSADPVSVRARWAGTSLDPAAELAAVREGLRGAGGVVADVGPVGIAWTTPDGDLVTVVVGRTLAVSVDSRCFHPVDAGAAPLPAELVPSGR